MDYYGLVRWGDAGLSDMPSHFRWLAGGGNLHYQMHHHHEVVLVGASVGLPPSLQWWCVNFV